MSDEQQSLQTHLQHLPERKPSWRFAYLNARQADGVENITKAIGVAEDAMFQRWQELSGQSGDIQERAQLQEASDELLRIKVQKLGWPDPISSESKKRGVPDSRSE